LVDGQGDEILAVGGGQLTKERHETVVGAIYGRAKIIGNRRHASGLKGYGSTALWDEVPQEAIPGRGLEHTFTCQEVQQTRVREQVETNMVRSDLLETHGTTPGTKPDGVCRILYENANGIDCRRMHNRKVMKARRLHDELEADVVAYNEHRLNMNHKDNRIGFNQLFHGGEADIQAVVAHNTHENVGRVQEGGTSMMVFGSMTQHVDLSHAKDPSGLGRWVVITLRGSHGFVTRIVCGYNPCGSGKAHSGTVYQQHRRFFLTKRRVTTCPRVKF
jgi:hypothetical protein